MWVPSNHICLSVLVFIPTKLLSNFQSAKTGLAQFWRDEKGYHCSLLKMIYSELDFKKKLHLWSHSFFLMLLFYIYYFFTNFFFTILEVLKGVRIIIIYICVIYTTKNGTCFYPNWIVNLFFRLWKGFRTIKRIETDLR